MKQQSLGDVQIQGDDNIFNVVQGETITLTQHKIIQISVDEIKTRQFIGTSPYKGLRRFESGDKDKFFGRDQCLTSLANELEHTNFVLLLGASGSGKSSVVRAGLIPWLSQKWGSSWVGLTLTPDRDPFESLHASLLTYFRQSEALLAKTEGDDTLSRLVGTLKTSNDYWFIFIDQFEELFTASDPKKRDRFITGLVQLCQEYAGDRMLKVVATMRSDFLDRLDAEPANYLARLTEGHRPLVTQMHPDELRLAIEQPAAQHGVVFETGLVEEIVKDVQGQAGYLPLLQYTLDMLWEQEVRDGGINDRTLNTQSYRDIGGVRGALQQRVENIYQGLSSLEQLATQRIFLRLVGIGGDTATETGWKPVRKRELRAQFKDRTEQRVLARLIDANLLVSDASAKRSGGGSTVEIAHEILLTSWSQLSTWIEQNREAIALRNRLNADVAQWKTEKLKDELWAGVKLAKAVELQQNPTFQDVLGGFSAEATAFLSASVGLRDSLEEEREARRQKELEQEREARRLAQRVTVGASIGSLFMTLLMFFSAFQMRSTEAQQIQALTALSRAELASDHSLDADIVVIRAADMLKKSFWQKFRPSSEVESAVLSQLQESAATGKEQNRLEGHEDDVRDVVYSPNGKLIASSGDDNVVRLWDTKGSELAAIDKSQEMPRSITFSPDSRLLAFGSKDDVVRIWNVDSEELTEFEAKQGAVYQLAFSSDSKRIVTSGEKKTVYLWSVEGKWLDRFDSEQFLHDLKFGPDDVYLAAGGKDGTTNLWHVASKRLTTLKGHQGRVRTVAFSPSGTQLATRGEDGSVRLWDMIGQQLAEAEGLGNDVYNLYNLAFSPDGEWLAAVGKDTSIYRWSVTNGQLSELKKLRRHEKEVTSIAFSPDSAQLVSTSLDGSVRLWNAEDGDLLDVLRGHEGGVWFAAFSPTSDQLATGGFDGTVRLWSLAGKSLAVLANHKGSVRSVAFSPDGSQIVTGGYDETARLWNAAGEQVNVLAGHDGKVDVAFSPDGSQIATAGNDSGIVRLWNSSGELLEEFRVSQKEISSVVFSPDNDKIAVSVKDGNTYLLTLADKQLEEFEGVESQDRRSVAFSPDGSQLVIGDEDGDARLWDISRKEMKRLEGHSAKIYDVAFSPDGTRIATGSLDGTALLWSVENHQQLKRLKGHHGAVWSVAFSADGQRLATGGSDGTARLWDVETGRQISKFQAHKGHVYGIAFNREGTQLLTGGMDGTARLWPVEQIDGLLSRQCDWVRDYLKHGGGVEKGDHNLCDGVATSEE